MKKIAKLCSLILVGALVLMMTACYPAVKTPSAEQQAKTAVVESIKQYREEKGLDPLKEVENLSKAEQAWVAVFGKAQKTSLSSADTVEAYNAYTSLMDAETAWAYDNAFGWTSLGGEDKLTAKYPATEAELKAQIAKTGVFDNADCKAFGIATVTINGEVYWTATVYTPAE